LDPKLAPALASLGISSLRRNQFAAARQFLEQAVAANSRNQMAHYYYAYTLYREIYSERQVGARLPEDKLKLMKAALDNAIQLAPDFPETYNLLGIIYLATGDNLGAGVNAVKKAMAIAPGREDYAMTLAQLYMRQEKFPEARQALEPLARDASRPEIRSRAESLLETIARIEQFKAQSNASTVAQTPAARGGERVATTSPARSGE